MTQLIFDTNLAANLKMYLCHGNIFGKMAILGFIEEFCHLNSLLVASGLKQLFIVSHFELLQLLSASFSQLTFCSMHIQLHVLINFSSTLHLSASFFR